MEFREIFEQVKANHEKLKSCSRHSFSIELEPTKVIGKRWLCEHCNGEVNTASKSWYEDGLRHGRNQND